MEDFSCAWLYQENVEELRQKLEYVKYELEITRKVTNAEMMKNNENIKKLLQLLQITCKERDEAISELKKLQQNLRFHDNKMANVEQNVIPTSTFRATPFSPNSPLLSNNNCLPQQCHVSSPVVVDSMSYNPLMTVLLSPDSNNIDFSRATSPIMATCGSSTTETLDRATLTIDNLAKGKPLPEQGSLLDAMMKAGPLLQTLMIGGPLPQWKNPPGSLARHVTFAQPKMCTNDSVGVLGQNNGQVKGLNGLPFYGQSSGGPMSGSPNSMLDFGSGSSGDSCLVGGCFDDPTPKRQRII